MRRNGLALALICLVGGVWWVAPDAAGWTAATENGEAPAVRGLYRGVSTAVKFDISPPLRSIPSGPIRAWKRTEREEAPTGLERAPGVEDFDPLVQSQLGVGEVPSPSVSFDGPNNIAGVSPPDPVGDVGPNHYVVMSNLYFAIYSKTGTLLLGPSANNTLWAGFGGPCQTENAGDPIVVYDQLADRWVLTQFTAAGPTYYNYVAVSQTGDPTGSYFRYAFSTGSNFPDYPKYGIWPDALYISTREFAGSTFAGVGAYAVNRAQLIAGNPAPQVISFVVPPGATAYNIGDGLLPSDLDGGTLPPAGSPNYFVGSMDNGGAYAAPQDALTLWKFTANFTTPASSSFVLTNTIPVAAFDSVYPCTPSSRNCLEQPSTTNRLDILSYRQRPMHRLAYRNFGTHESLVTNQSVEAATNIAGIRWYELRSPGSAPFIHQQGTYAPGTSDGIHRWMGSIAMDQQGNMALGYSVTNATTFPGVRYTGRLASDPLGTLPQGEGVFVNGTGSQTGSQRWGDYTSMNVDSSDDCTFWYVNQYVPTTSSTGWRLRIGSFKFPGCGGAPTPDFSLAVAPAALTVAQGASGNSTATVTSINGFNSAVSLSCSGLPAGASCAFVPASVTPPAGGSANSALTVSVGGATTPGTYPVTVSGVSGATTRTAALSLTVTGTTPVTVTFTSIAAEDGRIQESTETSNVGGTINATGTGTSALRTGDLNQDQQFKSVVSFDTSSIPDGATITSATLRLVRGSLTGTNPFTTHGSCLADIVSGAFGGANALAAGDFQAAATATGVATMSNPAANGSASTGSLNAAGLAAINKTGRTQLRLAFTLDDNDDTGSDYVGFYSGDNATAANRPTLTVTYTP